MKLYCITLRSRWGELYNVTIAGSSRNDAIKQVTPDPDWTVYSVVGVI